MLRPTLQGRAGFNPNGHGPGVGAPFGVSAGYLDGKTKHNGQDYFWLGAASATRLGISTEASKGVYPVVNGSIVPVSNSALGNGFYQQIDGLHRAYYWHLAAPVSGKTLGVNDRAATMGATGTATSQVHLHFEIRKAPYNMADRINPEPFFVVLTGAQKDRYRKIAAFLNPHAGNLGMSATATAADGVPGVNYWTLVQGLGRAWGFYSGAVDGKPGSLTYAAEAKLWAEHVNVAPPVVVEPVVVPEPVPVPVEPDPIVEPVPEPERTPEPTPDPVEPDQPQPTAPSKTSLAVILAALLAAITALVVYLTGGAL